MFLQILVLIAFAISCKVDSRPKSVIETPKQEEALEQAVETTFSQRVQLKRGGTFSGVLQKAGVGSDDIQVLIDRLRHRIDLRRLLPGTVFNVTWDDASKQSLLALSIRETKRKYLELIRPETDRPWQIRDVIPVPQVVRKKFRGVVKSNFWDSAVTGGLDATLIMEMAEIYSWVFDFSREVRVGDKWRVVVDELYLDNELIGRNPIEVAEYQSQSEVLTAVYYKKKGKKYGSYFTPEGQSLKRVFLKSPIKFGRVTSRFNKRRFHPILRKKVPHNGVDYGAPTGTPVRTVGDGRVQFAGRNGASGIMVKIRHNHTYSTAYLHLSRIKPEIRRGTKVEQGMVIGYVGSTGRATGPHLHFAFYESGRFVDPLGRKFPSADPVPQQELAEFEAASSQSLAELPRWSDKWAWYDPAGELGLEPQF